MRFTKEDFEFFDSMEYGLKIELARAHEYHEALKVSFVKGKLEMLRLIRIRDKVENEPTVKFKI